MAVVAQTGRMHPMSPIALVQSTDAVREALRGSGPDGAPVAERARRRRRAPGAASERSPQRAQSGSDQCRIVAPGRKPARA